MAVAGETFRPIAILDIRRWAAAVARTSQRRLELALNHRLDELTYPLTQSDFDRVKPIVEKIHRRLRFRLQDRRRRANLGHGVVSTGAPTPGLIWVSPPGDYAIVNSNHIPDGTARHIARYWQAPPWLNSAGPALSIKAEWSWSPATAASHVTGADKPPGWNAGVQCRKSSICSVRVSTGWTNYFTGRRTRSIC